MRFLFVVAMLFMLTACSELRIIGGAAVREFKAEGIRTDQLAYNVNKK